MEMLSKSRNVLRVFSTALLVLLALGGTAKAQEAPERERRGLLERIFSGNKQSRPVPPTYNERVHDAYMDRETDTVSAGVAEPPPTVEQRTNDPVRRYPDIPGYSTIRNSSQKNIEDLIEMIYEAYEARIDKMDPPDLRGSRIRAMGTIPDGFPSLWKSTVDAPVWPEQRTVHHSMEDIYRRTLEYSNQIKAFSDLPLIRETGMQEADGEFDIETFIEGRSIRRNEPIGSTLTTGNAARRFREDEDYVEGGVRKKFFTGGEATLSNRFSTLGNNSSFLVPQEQGSSEMVLSVVQPLLEGGGYHYNQSKIKLAKFDARMASAEFVRQLQDHLVQVNRSYWALYYARSYYLLSRDLVDSTGGILDELEERFDLDALQSEVLRARASLATRQSILNRAEMAIRNSEERLRVLVNDPDHDIGSNTEIIPATPPIMSRFVDDVREVAREALRNRSEIQQGFDELRAAIVRRDVQKNQKWPTLNIVAELMLGDIEPNDATGRAFQDQFGDGTGYAVGFQFEQPWDNDKDRAQLLRSEFELRQTSNQLRSTIDLVLLEALVSYRELITAYRDMQGRFSALNASREELRQLRERLEVDTEEEGGRTTASQLQLILDSMDRRQSAEELFLDSVVAYNSSFAALERAKGTLLRSEDVDIDRVLDTDATHPGEDLERLQVGKPTYVTGKTGETYRYGGTAPETSSRPVEETIPEVPPLSANEASESGSAVSRGAPSTNRTRKRDESAARNADNGLFAERRSSRGGTPSVNVVPAAVRTVEPAPETAPIPVPGQSQAEVDSAANEADAPAPVRETPAASVRKVAAESEADREAAPPKPSASARPVGN
ncbi:MAG: TolC family protein [Verrucomicrobiales bacterium]